jgi:hypothetical protein
MDEFDDGPRTPAPEQLDAAGAAPAASHTQGGDFTQSERDEGFAEAHGAEQNGLLAALPLDEFARLLPRLTPVRLHLKDVLVEVDVPIRDVWFVRRASAPCSRPSRKGAPSRSAPSAAKGWVGGDAFEMTHEFLSLMLGVRRAGVTVAIGALQAAGVLWYTRGRVSVLDRRALEETSCGCYRVTRTACARLLG